MASRTGTAIGGRRGSLAQIEAEALGEAPGPKFPKVEGIGGDDPNVTGRLGLWPQCSDEDIEVSLTHPDPEILPRKRIMTLSRLPTRGL